MVRADHVGEREVKVCQTVFQLVPTLNLNLKLRGSWCSTLQDKRLGTEG